MRLRRLLLLAIIASAAVAVVRRLRRRPQERVDVYLADGSLTSLGEDDPSGAALLSLARRVRGAA